jgi:hypothetical protein
LHRKSTMPHKQKVQRCSSQARVRVVACTETGVAGPSLVEIPGSSPIIRGFRLKARRMHRVTKPRRARMLSRLLPLSVHAGRSRLPRPIINYYLTARILFERARAQHLGQVDFKNGDLDKANIHSRHRRDCCCRSRASSCQSLSPKDVEGESRNSPDQRITGVIAPVSPVSLRADEPMTIIIIEPAPSRLPRTEVLGPQ